LPHGAKSSTHRGEAGVSDLRGDDTEDPEAGAKGGTPIDRAVGVREDVAGESVRKRDANVGHDPIRTNCPAAVEIGPGISDTPPAGVGEDDPPGDLAAQGL
jgi:hypothetical protein